MQGTILHREVLHQAVLRKDRSRAESPQYLEKVQKYADVARTRYFSFTTPMKLPIGHAAIVTTLLLA